MVIKELFQGDCIHFHNAFVFHILPERHSFQRIWCLPSGHIHFSVVYLKQGGTGVDNSEVVVFIHKIFENDTPILVFVDFVNVELGYTPSIHKLDEIL